MPVPPSVVLGREVTQMNTTTDNAKQLRKALVALVSVALLVAASPVYSVPAEGTTVACQSGYCGG